MALPTAQDVKLWLALLYEIQLRGGDAKPLEVFPALRKHFSEITDEDLALHHPSGESKWTNNIRWARQRLVERGCIDPSIPGVWRITPLGREWLQASWRGADADYSAVVKPPVVPKADAAPEPPTSPQVGAGKGAKASKPDARAATAEPTGEPAPQPKLPTTLADPTEMLCERIHRSQRQSSAPEQFEKDLAEAFEALGFAARHIGGSGETDIYVEARIGRSSYSVVIDAKSTATGKVPDAQINWPVIDSHRQARGATYAAVIGPDFGGGQLLKFASQYGVVLLTTDMVCGLLRLHAKTPFSLFELRDLFGSPGLAADGVKALAERHNQQHRHWALVGEVVDTMSLYGFEGLKQDNLYHILRTLAISRGKAPADVPTQLDVADAIAFLASRAVGVLAEVQGSGGAYQLTMSAETARKRLSALARAVDGTGGNQSAASEPGSQG
jgi:Mrr N-terminal domain